MEFPEYVRSEESWQTGEVVKTFPEHARFNVEWFDGSESTERLDGEGRDWEALMSRETATTCLDIVRKYTHDDTATLHNPGFHADGWTIALEGGPDEWPIKISVPGQVDWPGGVRVEAQNHWCLSIFLD